MKNINYYEELNRVGEDSSPLPKEPKDIPTRAIPINPDEPDEPIDRAYIEAELDVEKHGVPIIEVERPPVPKVNTDPTKYKKVAVKRREKRSDGKDEMQEDALYLYEDREMKAWAEILSIPKKKTLWQKITKKIYNLSCKIETFAFNVINKLKRKKYKDVSHKEHILPSNIKTIALDIATEHGSSFLGREREYKREEDKSPSTIKMVRNKKTGVVVATPSISKYKAEIKDKDKNVADYEVVDSQIKG